MRHDLTHASFFSGVGGLDLGLERAGWRTVSFSEIDPYASAVLAERWPGVPNLGCIKRVAGWLPKHIHNSKLECIGSDGVRLAADGRPDIEHPADALLTEPEAVEWTSATLWTGGFPCQDLSVAGKRRGLAGERSGLAFAFLDLVERHRPPAILLENVPGLLSSHRGRDLGTLLGRLGELGYWWAYRILDAQFFGVPQRRRRVFICALHAGAGFGADSPAEVLSVGARCGGHSQAGDEVGPGTAPSVARSITASSGHHGHSSPRGDGSDNLVGTLDGTFGHHGYALGTQAAFQGHLRVSPPPNADRVREADGLAGRMDHREVVGTLRVGPQRPQDGGPGDTVPIIVNALDQRRGGVDDNEAQAGHIVSGVRVPEAMEGSPLLPLGLDSHRYRCCGNGVVSNVSEWIGVRLARVFA